MRLKRLLVGSLLSLSACKPPTPAEQLESALSWIATAGMTGDAWLRHTTPDRYTRQTLELSNKTLLELAADLLESPAPGIDSAALDSVLTSSRGHIARMARLVEAKNSPAFQLELDSLRGDQKTVKQLADIAESKQ